MGKSAKATRGGNKLRKNPVRDLTKQTDNLKIKTKKAVERLEGVAKKTTGGALAKGQLPNQKAKRIQTSAKRKCTIK